MHEKLQNDNKKDRVKSTPTVHEKRIKNEHSIKECFSELLSKTNSRHNREVVLCNE